MSTIWGEKEFKGKNRTKTNKQTNKTHRNVGRKRINYYRRWEEKQFLNQNIQVHKEIMIIYSTQASIQHHSNKTPLSLTTMLAQYHCWRLYTFSDKKKLIKPWISISPKHQKFFLCLLPNWLAIDMPSTDGVQITPRISHSDQ